MFKYGIFDFLCVYQLVTNLARAGILFQMLLILISIFDTRQNKTEKITPIFLYVWHTPFSKIKNQMFTYIYIDVYIYVYIAICVSMKSLKSFHTKEKIY